MNNLKQFILSFKGLKKGSHKYHFDISDWFFENFEYSEIKKGEIAINLTLLKEERMMIFEFSLKGHINLLCDRCLDSFDFPIKSHQHLIVKFGAEYCEESEDVLIIPETEHQIDVSHYIYEYIVLCLPIKRIHTGNKQCNSKMIENYNKTDNREERTDPTWDILKDLKTLKTNNNAKSKK